VEEELVLEEVGAEAAHWTKIAWEGAWLAKNMK